MRAAWVTPDEADAGPDDLKSEGIATETFEPSQADAMARRLGATRGYATTSDVTRSASNPKDDAALAKEADEHAHIADEMRLVIHGEAVFDVLSNDGTRWLRLWVAAGDAILIPARRYHRMLAPPATVLRYVEVYGEPSGLLPLYRVSDDQTRAV